MVAKLKVKQGKKDIRDTEIIVVLDRSGSMCSIAEDMKGGFDSLIKEQRELPGACAVTLVQFDDKYEVSYRGLPLDDVPSLELTPRGMTALVDAVGRTITGEKERIEAIEGNPQVLFIVITDGFENASSEYSRERVRELVEKQRANGWEFVFLGADEKAFDDAAGIGFSKDSLKPYEASTKGTQVMAQSLSAGIRSYRSCGSYSQEGE